ncbi:MAG: AI-2E family transporter [Armatimonadetes bacterium]|nr:AI-2E family transporter [Armatimonadota bacterium]
MHNSQYPRVMTVAALLVALAAAVYLFQHLYVPIIAPVLEVVPPFAIALVFALLLDPIVDWLGQRHVSRGLGVAMVGLGFAIVFVLVGLLLVPRLAEQAGQLAENLPNYIKRATEAINIILASHKLLLERLHLPTTASEMASHFSTQIERAATNSLAFVASALSTVVSKLLWIIIIPLATLWLLKDLDYIKAKVVHLTPEKYKDRLMRTSAAVGGVFARYVRGMVAVAVVYSVFASIWLSTAGLDYALIIGGFSGLLYLVPYIGALTTILAAGTAALATGHSLGYTAGVTVGLAVQNFLLFDLVVAPKIVGGNVGVHPVLMLFSLALGARLFGVVGMIVAVPFAASLQVALAQYFPRILDDLRKNPPNRSK